MKTRLEKLASMCATVVMMLSCSEKITPTPTPPVTPTIKVTHTHEGAMTDFSLAGSGTAEVDWGDGSPVQTVDLKTLTMDSYGNIDTRHNFSHTYAAGSGVKTIKVTGKITGLDTGHSAATTAVDVSAMPELQYLDLYDEQISSLDVTKNVSLKWLKCPFNTIQTLDLSNNVLLTSLMCHSNSLVRLDVSRNTALTEIFCYNNALTSLDVTKNVALKGLYCSDNAINSLNVANLTRLTTLICHDNRLGKLDLMGCTALETVGCNWNYIEKEQFKAIFSALPNRTAGSQGQFNGGAEGLESSFVVSQNPGWTSLTDDDKKVAIDKNWAVN